MPKTRGLAAPTALRDRSTRGAGRRAGVLALAAAVVLWGLNWPALKLSLQHITPLWLSFLRFAFGGACLLVLQIVRGELRLPQRADWPFVASIGLLHMMLNTALVMVALTHLPAGRTAMLSYTTPVFVVPASILLFREPVVPQRLAGAGLALIGVIVLMNPATVDWSDPTALGAHLMLLAASLLWSVCILHLRYFKSPSTAYRLAPWQMLLAALPLAIVAGILEGPFTADGSATFWLTLIYVGPVATAFCFIAVNGASTWLSPATMTTAMLGVPVTGILLSVTLLGEPATVGLAVGSIAVLAGIAINALPSSRAATPRRH